MRCASSSAQLVEGELAGAVGNTRASWARRAGVRATLTDDQGLVGQGEASPLPGWSREPIGACQRVLARAHVWLQGCDLGVPAREAVVRALAPRSADLDEVPSARFALETALFDLIGQRTGRSIAACLGDGPVHPRIPLSGLIPVAAPDLAEAAHRLVSRGIRTVKIKVGARGAAFDRQLAEIAGLRRDLPRGVAMRLDANGSWTLEEAREHLRRLVPIDPEWVEEPTAGDALLALGRSAVPWAADESLADPARAARLLDVPRGEGCAAVVIKPALLGGLCAGWDLARRAQERGLQVVVTHLFDGPIALAAACELALALPRLPAACGLDVHDGLSIWPSTAIPQLAQGSAIAPSNLPGLGLPPLGVERVSRDEAQ